MTKFSIYLSAILFLIPCLAQGQEVPATGSAKHEFKKPVSTQTKESKPVSMYQETEVQSVQTHEGCKPTRRMQGCLQSAYVSSQLLW